MVHDHFQPRIPRDWSPPGLVRHRFLEQAGWPWTAPADPAIDSLRKEVGGLRQLILDFREAVEAAKKVDALTAQPDCVDPEKAKLEERVTDLERRLDAVGQAFAPGPKPKT